MERFYCGVNILAGKGAVSALGSMGIRRLLLVTDPYFSKNGTAARIAALTGAQAVEIFDGIQPDPTVALAARGTALVQRFQPDTLVALGGGSAMDCAKAMGYFARIPLRLIAIPTTSGSGSEVTDFAVLTHKGVKHPLVDEALRPHTAILDSDLLAQLPPSLVADAGFDVLSHALESFVATGAGALTDALAADAFCAALHGLPASFRGDLQVRGAVHMAATMAGMAFTQSGLGVCHAMAHSLGGAFHVPHGRLGAILLPAVIGCNAAAAGEKYASLARRAGLGGSAVTVAVRNLRGALTALRRQLQLPDTLAQAGVDPNLVRSRRGELVEAALADPCCKTNPAPVDAAMLGSLLDAVTGHG